MRRRAMTSKRSAGTLSLSLSSLASFPSSFRFPSFPRAPFLELRAETVRGIRPTNFAADLPTVSGIPIAKDLLLLMDRK